MVYHYIATSLHLLKNSLINYFTKSEQSFKNFCEQWEIIFRYLPNLLQELLKTVRISFRNHKNYFPQPIYNPLKLFTVRSLRTVRICRTVRSFRTIRLKFDHFELFNWSSSSSVLRVTGPTRLEFVE